MPYSRGAFVFLAGLLLSSSPATAQTMAEARACTASVYNSPAAAPLRPHVPLDPVNATPAQLSDPSYPTLSEISAIKAVYPQLQYCRQQAIAALSNTPFRRSR